MAIAVVVGIVGLFTVIRSSATQHPAPAISSALPQPVPQPIIRTSPAAQVAWLSAQNLDRTSYLVGVDPEAKIVGRIDQPTAGLASHYGFWRSADGASIFTAGSDQVMSYSALDGAVQKTFSRAAGSIIGDAFSPDGRWLALLLLNGSLQLDLIDLQGGPALLAPVTHDAQANLPGMTCTGGCGDVAWGTAAFSPDSSRIYTLTDWGGPLRLTAFMPASGKLTQQATAIDGQGGRAFPACNGPALVAKVVAGGTRLATFCHANGAISIYDLSPLALVGDIHSNQPNPFGLSPVFTLDGQLLYLFPGRQVVDLRTQRLFPEPPKSNALGWLVKDVAAGGVASTMPVSPDGRWIYSSGGDGIAVLRVPDLTEVGKLATGFRLGDVWASGDGKTLFALANPSQLDSSDAGRKVLVIPAAGGVVKPVLLSGVTGGFIASEHG